MAGGQRGRVTKVKHYGAEEVVNPVLLSGGTQQEACEAFEKFTGEPISRFAISRHNGHLQLAAEKMRNLELLVDKMLEHEGYYEGADPGEKAAALARRMLLARAVEAAADIPPEMMRKMPPDKLAQMIARLESSRISGERLRLQYNKAFDTAKEAILEKLEEEMHGHPKLLEEVAQLAEKAFGEAVNEVEGRG